MTTIAALVAARADDPHPGLVFEDRRWTYGEYVRCCADRAALLAALRRPGPFHVGVLLENVPEFVMWLGAAAVARATIVGINPTRRGAELEQDIRHTNCQLIVTSAGLRGLLDGLDFGVQRDRILDVESPEYADALRPHIGAPLPDDPAEERDVLAIIFTSGTSGAPKGVLCSQVRLGISGTGITQLFNLTPNDVIYEAMPLFHSMALNGGWVPALTSGATLVLRRRFSATAFLSDVRRYGVTYFNYVGKPLAYVLATPERPDDADNPLRIAFGNEAGPDAERFARRFGCTVFDAYGSTEGGAIVWRTPQTPPGSLGPALEGMTVLDPETGEECPPARFDDSGRLTNADEAIGELVNKRGVAAFEGYWRNDEATAARVRSGYYWSGDLAYRDERGFLYFAGRDYDWLRVDGENFSAVPVENILNRHPDVVVATVFAVPAPDSGDDVMAVLELRPGAAFDPREFEAFLLAQRDLGTKWSPRFVRIATATPLTQTTKVVKRELRRERWASADPVWWRPWNAAPYQLLTNADRDDLHAQVAARGRLL